MLAHVLALHLALLDPVAAPEVHVLPPLALAGPLEALEQAGAPAPPIHGGASPADAPAATGGATSETPTGAPPMVVAEPRRGSVLAGYGGGLVGTLVADLVLVGAFAMAASNIHLFSNSSSDAAWGLVLLTSGIGLLFATPAATVWAAQRAEGYERPGYAYAAVFAVRLAGFLMAVVFPPLVLATELVAAPLVAAAVAAGGTPIGQRTAEPPDFADEPAPAAQAGRTPRPKSGLLRVPQLTMKDAYSPPLSPPRCPEPAFALR